MVVDPAGRELTFRGPRAAAEGPRRAGGRPLPPRPPYRMWSFAYNITAPVNCRLDRSLGVCARPRDSDPQGPCSVPKRYFRL